ncbi:MAG TPA: hypothetical protein VL563_00860 [Gemmatimonadales bacterium]|nr:hypothetical protein [Gemmatimonadales bacterium]
MRLVFLALIGLLAPGGLFLYWMLNDYTSVAAALADKMALAFFLDLLMSTFLLAYLFARGRSARSSGTGSSLSRCLALSLSASRCSSGSTGAERPFRGVVSPSGGAPSRFMQSVRARAPMATALNRVLATLRLSR